ncbi:hypothetical protein QYE76_071352 [Lolium multiflorum]|uniref:Uncharacterized protein n=1 Tax=Lolium multiflorum TaxID=4521 RepID=A0AAD8SLY4_LOLMU|nr:hypothetical protein QYE76_071352 [Lolium multiflorum]
MENYSSSWEQRDEDGGGDGSGSMEKPSGALPVRQTQLLALLAPISHMIKNVNSGSLSDVHKSVTDAFAPSVLFPGQASSSASASPSYTQFLHTLVKSGSDKAFMIQKKYKKELGPILEAVNEEDFSEEQVDYDTTDSESVATSERYINPGQGVMALAVPSLQERVTAVLPADGSQPKIDGTQEAPLSQVDNPTDMETNDGTDINESLTQAGGGS